MYAFCLLRHLKFNIMPNCCYIPHIIFLILTTPMALRLAHALREQSFYDVDSRPGQVNVYIVPTAAEAVPYPIYYLIFLHLFDQ